MLSDIIGAGLGVAGSIASGIMGGNAEEQAYQRRLKAYNEAIQRAQDTQQAGETSLYENLNTPNSYLGEMQKQLNDNTNKTLNSGRDQLNTSLAQAGVRGGQAATQLARGIGSMVNDANNNLTQLNYNDEAQRKNLKSAYEMAKAQAGTNAYLQQFQG